MHARSLSATIILIFIVVRNESWTLSKSMAESGGNAGEYVNSNVVLY